MFPKNTFLLNTALVLMLFAGHDILAKKAPSQTDNEIRQTLGAIVTDQNALEAFFSFVDKELSSHIKKASNNVLACGLNLLNGQFFLYEKMASIFNNPKQQQNEEKIKEFMERYQSAIEAYQKQCPEPVHELNKQIQEAISGLVPQDTMLKIQKLQEEMQQLYDKVSKNPKLAEDPKVKEKALSLQNDLMHAILELQAITSLANLLVYYMVYQAAEAKDKSLLLRRFDENGLIPMTKRKEYVVQPAKALDLVNAFLKQANSSTPTNN